MSSLCASDCTDFALTTITNAACKTKERRRNLKRIGFYKCDVTIPDNYTCANLLALMKPTSPATPALVFTNELQDVQFAEPTMVTRELSDSRPEYEMVVSRDVDFKDRIAVDLDALGAAAPYTDFSWWKNIQDNSTTLNVCFLFDDDTLEIPRAADGLTGLPNTFRIYRNFEKVQNGFIVELKQGKIKFLGDPLQFNKPGISLSTCPDLAGLF